MRRDAVAGGVSASDQTVESTQQRSSKIASVGFDYDLDAKSRINGGFSYNRRAETLTIGERNRAADPAGLPLRDYDRLGAGRGHETSTQLSADYRRTLANNGEFTLDLQRGETKEDRRRTYVSRFRTPPGPDFREELIPRADEVTNEISAEYAGALPGKAKLKLGYDLQRDDDDYDNYGGTIVGDLHVVYPAQTNRFLYKRTVHAVYARRLCDRHACAQRPVRAPPAGPHRLPQPVLEVRSRRQGQGPGLRLRHALTPEPLGRRLVPSALDFNARRRQAAQR